MLHKHVTKSYWVPLTLTVAVLLAVGVIAVQTYGAFAALLATTDTPMAAPVATNTSLPPDSGPITSITTPKYLPTPAPQIAVPGKCSQDWTNYNIAQQGTVTVQSNNLETKSVQTFSDYCIPGTNQVVKYSCGTNTVHADTVTCPSRCVNGMCKGTVYVAYTVDTEAMSDDDTSVFNTHLTSYDFQPGGLVDKVTDPNGPYRTYTDSFGGYPKYSWFELANDGYCQSVQQDCTFVHDAMKAFSARIAAEGDELAFHYHNFGWAANLGSGIVGWTQLLSMNGQMTATGTDVQLGDRAVAAVLINQHMYPSSFRSGWAWENTDYSQWLEHLFPFDFSNISPLANPLNPADIGQGGGIGNIYDWSRAPTGSNPYHPSPTDYQVPGSDNRAIFRSVNDASSMFKAFGQADSGYDAFIVTVTHTFNQGLGMEYRKTLNSYAQSYPNVKYKFVTATEGARAMLHLTDTTTPNVLVTRTGSTFRVTSNKPLFAFPFAAVQVSVNDFRRLYPLVQSPVVSGSLYSWTYDASSIASLKTTATQPVIAFGGTDASGNTFVTNTLAL